jgi:hypothetical protein
VTRPLTPAMAKAMRQGRPRGLLVAIEHPDGTGRFCTTIGSREWGGYTWRGAGPLGSVSPIKHSSEIAIQDITFRLSGIDTAIVEGLSDDVRNRNGSAWLVCFDDADQVIPDPYQIIDSQLDFQRYESDPSGGTTSIEVVAHAGFYTLDRGVEEAWTPENQKLTYPTDTGLDMIPGLQHQDLQWTPS